MTVADHTNFAKILSVVHYRQKRRQTYLRIRGEMNVIRINKRLKFGRSDIEQFCRSVYPHKITFMAAVCAVGQCRFRSFSDQLDPFKLNNDLPLSFCCHKVVHLRVRIVARQ